MDQIPVRGPFWKFYQPWCMRNYSIFVPEQLLKITERTHMKKEKISALVCALLFSSGLLAQSTSELEARMEKKAREVISQMTVDEKISQMMNYTPGIERMGIKPYDWWGEALHGVARNGRATVFPQSIGLGATFDPEIIQRMADAIASEGRAKFNIAQSIGNYYIYAGLTYWSPNVNIFRDPRWGRGMETFGEDPYLSGIIGGAFVKGLQGDHPFYLKTAACAKHYAVHSGPEADRHSFDVNPSKRDLYETYLPAFQMLVKDAKVEAVMGAYNRVYGESASGSKFLLLDILRDEWGFKGHIVSDCGAVTDIYTGHHLAKSHAEASAIAIKNGLNLECGGSFRHIKEALEQNLLTERDLDEALFPLMMTRLKLGILTPDDESPYNNIPESVVACEAHAAIAREAARKSMVLLKNQNGVLPLDKKTKSIYVVGPHATDVFSMMGNYFGVSNRYSTYLQGIADQVSSGTSINYKLGFLPLQANLNDIEWGIGEAKSTEVCIVVLGNTGAMEGEEGDAIASEHRGDKVDLKLPESQLDFMRKLRHGNRNKIVTVVTGGGPIDLTEIYELSDAVVMAWYSGQEGGYALGDLIFGDVNFSGRLPVTFPVSVDALPAFEDYTMQGRTYKYMDDNIMFPFGYGLTYSNVTYGEATLLNPKHKGKEAVQLQITLKNESDREVEEVAQVYVTAPGAGVSTPFASLVGFKRVKMRPNSSQTVEFQIEPDQLMMVQEDGTKKLMKGDYILTVSGAAPGSRSEELGITGSQVQFKL